MTRCISSAFFLSAFALGSTQVSAQEVFVLPGPQGEQFLNAQLEDASQTGADWSGGYLKRGHGGGSGRLGAARGENRRLCIAIPVICPFRGRKRRAGEGLRGHFRGFSIFADSGGLGRKWQSSRRMPESDARA